MGVYACMHYLQFSCTTKVTNKNQACGKCKKAGRPQGEGNTKAQGQQKLTNAAYKASGKRKATNDLQNARTSEARRARLEEEATKLREANVAFTLPMAKEGLEWVRDMLAAHPTIKEAVDSGRFFAISISPKMR
jgi:hypothetical protein